MTELLPTRRHSRAAFFRMMLSNGVFTALVAAVLVSVAPGIVILSKPVQYNKPRRA
ncbi:hypothetical protein BDZ89DRAFT_1151866 [Hymenopellis radicata]|nr:hypothetical protein BDZ89DRAFT_1151866 [Hymenopellis radicata]